MPLGLVAGVGLAALGAAAFAATPVTAVGLGPSVRMLLPAVGSVVAIGPGTSLRIFLPAAGSVAAIGPATSLRMLLPAAGSGVAIGPGYSLHVRLPTATPAPDTVFAKPSSAAVELFATLRPSDNLKSLLLSSGVARADATAAADLVHTALPAGVPRGTEIEVLLGDSIAKGERRLERVSFQPGPAFRVTIGRTLAGDLRLARDALSVDASPQRFRGRAGPQLFWSLRAAGVPAQAARDYLEALATRLDVRQVQPDDRFDLVIDHWRDAGGNTKSGALLYAALRRGSGGGVQLVRWTVGDRTGWFDPSRPQQRIEGFGQPVQGHLTSAFGYRIHPILRFARFHAGVDIGAPWGTPVYAAEDGVVSAAGWAGGYGRQVRLDHAGGIQTSYAHLSQLLAVPGTRVRRGQVIGLVGSSGFSTGAHLHFEVKRFGQPVDPLTFRHAGFETIGAGDLAALRARLDQLRSI